MARPSKCRKVCVLPKIISMEPVRRHPLHSEEVADSPIVITVDEYETIRLIDHVGLTQAECSSYMDMARTSVQAMYQKARKKIAQALVEGRALHIDGGNYKLYEDLEKPSCHTCEKKKKSHCKCGKGEEK